MEANPFHTSNGGNPADEGDADTASTSSSGEIVGNETNHSNRMANNNFSANRPTTANSVIEMLHIEKVQDGSGLTCCGGGVFVASQCQVILFVMSGIFTVVGAILSAISYRPRDFGEDIDKFFTRQAWSSDLKIIGPVFLVCGMLMLAVGLGLCIISRTISKDDVQSLQSATGGGGGGNHVMPDTKYYMGIQRLQQSHNQQSFQRAHSPAAMPTVSPSQLESMMMQQPPGTVEHQPNFAHPDTPPIGSKSLGDRSVSCDDSGSSSKKPTFSPVIDSLVSDAHISHQSKANKVHPMNVTSTRGSTPADGVAPRCDLANFNQYGHIVASFGGQSKQVTDIACFPSSVSYYSMGQGVGFSPCTSPNQSSPPTAVPI